MVLIFYRSCYRIITFLMKASFSRISQYAPLLTIITLAVLGSLALAVNDASELSFSRSMHAFMGLFLLQFSALKLFNVSGFAKGFARYDLLAMRWKSWGKVYPFVELVLALGYLAGGAIWVYLTTFIVMGFGAFGVLRALKKGLNTNCACLGTTLKVPLSTVAVTENISMVLMSVFMYFSAS